MSANPPLRLLITETMDPDGAMYRWLSPDVEALGWEVLRFPVQQAVHHLGVRPMQQHLLELTRRFRPHVVLVHPPYDYLDAETSAAIRSLGTRLCAFAFDDSIYNAFRRRSGLLEQTWAELGMTYDLYCATDGDAVSEMVDSGIARARTLRFASSTAPHESMADLEPELEAQLKRSAVLVGRPYSKRIELLSEIASDDYAIHVFGDRWETSAVLAQLPTSVVPHGFLTREQMNAVYRAAGVVITTGDWSSHDVPMVKYRLLEVAMAGGFQIAQDSPDLRSYFAEDLVPAYQTANELKALIKFYFADPEGRRTMASRARQRALDEHRWRQRWLEFTALLDEVGRPLVDTGEAGPLPSYSRLLSTLALHAESAGRPRVAREHHQTLVTREPDNSTALAGLGRCLYVLGQPDLAIEPLERALDHAVAQTSPAARGLFVRVPNQNLPLGLGRLGYLDPSAELLAYLISCLLDANKLDDARQRLDALIEADEPDLLVTVASLLQIDDVDEHRPFWRRLFERALAAEPVQQAGLKAEHESRWLGGLHQIYGGAQSKR